MLQRSFSEHSRLFIRGFVFAEDRENGTPLQVNDTHIRQLSLWIQLAVRGSGRNQRSRLWKLADLQSGILCNSSGQEFRALTRSQRVPAQQRGFTLQWSRQAGTHQTLVAGIDGREVRGASDELGFVGGNLTSAVGAGGRQRTFGFFGQDIVRITPKWLLTVGGRVDRWRHHDALSTNLVLLPVQLRFASSRNELRPLSVLDSRCFINSTIMFRLSVSGYRSFGLRL